MAKPAKKIPKPRERISVAMNPKLYGELTSLCTKLEMTVSEVTINLYYGLVAGRIKLTRPPEVDQAIKEVYE